MRIRDRALVYNDGLRRDDRDGRHLVEVLISGGRHQIFVFLFVNVAKLLEERHVGADGSHDLTVRLDLNVNLAKISAQGYYLFRLRQGRFFFYLVHIFLLRLS